MKRSTLVLAVCALLFIGIGGCNRTQKEAPATQAQPGAAMPQVNGSLSGKVVETMNSGGYTYVNLSKDGAKTWVAIPQTTVKVGQEVTCKPGMEMKNFTSKTLHRTFESIYFSGGLM